MIFERHQYPPMLGPLEAVPAGTPAWAERLGLRILNAVETTEQHGVDRLIPLVEMALEAGEPKPWNVFPEGRPCRTPDKYLRYAAGVDCVSVAKLIAAYKGEAHPLVRQLQRCTAEAERVIAEENEKRGMSNPDVLHIRVPRPGSRNTSYLLRRLARDHPDILAAYERGEFKTPTAAARAAGIIKDKTSLEKIQALLPKLSDAERAELRAELHKLAKAAAA
jgi:hypothetical protein